MTEPREYILAEHGIPGWHVSSADGASSVSGIGHAFAEAAKYLTDGAVVIDKADLFDSDSFVSDVYRCPMLGKPRKGAFLETLREAPYMIAVVENYGLLGATSAQAIAESQGAEYGPMDYAPVAYLAEYWRERGARIGRYRTGTDDVEWETER